MNSGYPAITTPQVSAVSYFSHNDLNLPQVQMMALDSLVIEFFLFQNKKDIYFPQLQMDCAKFDISLEEESWIGN